VKRKKILVLSYSISPLRGSEYSVGWNYVVEMSKNNDLVVLYGAAGSHMGEFKEIQESSNCIKMENVEFVPITPSTIANLLNILNKHGLFIYSFYFAYRLWHKSAYKIALELIKKQHIDLIHYLCPIGFREPGFLYSINKPYIWGPIGGFNNISLDLISKKKIILRTKIALRNFVNSIQFRFSSRFKESIKRCDALLVSTSANRSLMLGAHKVETTYIPENGPTIEMLKKQRIIYLDQKDALNIVWVGRIENLKGLDMLLLALGNLTIKKWHLSIVGSGSQMKDMQLLAKKLNIDSHINWLGYVSRETVGEIFQASHLHIVTSLHEGNPTVIWEAMSFGIPTISLDHCGMHDVICEKCGIKIPLSGTRNVINMLTEKIGELLKNPHLITVLSTGVYDCSRKYSWDKRVIFWENIYSKAILNWNIKNNLYKN